MPSGTGKRCRRYLYRLHRQVSSARAVTRRTGSVRRCGHRGRGSSGEGSSSDERLVKRPEPGDMVRGTGRLLGTLEFGKAREAGGQRPNNRFSDRLPGGPKGFSGLCLSPASSRPRPSQRGAGPSQSTPLGLRGIVGNESGRPGAGRPTGSHRRATRWPFQEPRAMENRGC